jgi:hypothetical protein
VIADSRLRIAGSGLCLCGLVLAVVGYFGPWVPHETAALTVTGFELAEFAKFFPQVQGGVVPVARVLFLTPVIAAAILLGLWVNRRGIRLALRLVGVGCAVVLALAALPPYQYLLDPSYRAQLVLTVGGVGFVLPTLLACRLPQRGRGILTALLALAGAVPALWQFVLLHPLIIALYGGVVGLGWGLIVCTAGFALVLGGEILGRWPATGHSVR